MRIILANRYFSPDESATSRMVSSLAFALAAQGIEVRVLTGRARYEAGAEPCPARETLSGTDVHRIWSTQFGRRTLPGRALDYLSFHASALMWLLTHTRRGDICIVCTDPPLLSCTAALALAATGGSLVNWIMDLYPELAIDAGLIPRGGLVARTTIRLRDLSLRAARCTVAPTRAMAKVVEDRGIPADRVSVLPHWASGEAIRPMPAERSVLRRCWGLDGKFVVGYSGNLGRSHEFGTLLDAASRLSGRADIVFLIVGDGFRRAQVEDGVRQRGLRNVMMQPLQPRELLSDCLAAADVHLVSLLPEMEPYVVPSKFFGIAAAARPTFFIGAPDGEIAQLLIAGDCGLSFRIGEAQQLADAIAAYAAAPERCRVAGENAFRLFGNAFTETRGVRDWNALLARVAAGEQPLVLERQPADR
ncbi:glycosyltransferase family 4 protein [Bosea sp. 117]|uniref:glycosyltransferase family 4 protein n=1 Tax=Bosea sp. 117 TaxID=1125973 RepID=UPI0004945353|nr:glycosyltransferase family 4 protein [Bosea sp. 117]